MVEEWRPVAGFPLYEVSDLGRVRSLGCVVARQPRPGKVLKPSPRRTNGKVTWYAVNLGRGNMRRVHRLVLEAFVGPAPDGLVACHNDGDCSNNALRNLRWDTPKANTADMLRHGTYSPPPTTRGEAHPSTVLTAAAVRFIRAQPQRRGVLAELSRKFGVSNQTILRVRRGVTWAHV